MPTRTAHARWEGTIKEGKGTLDFGNGAFKGAYSFGSRFEDGAGTNPEELLGAAHAGCFAMALSLVLGMAGFTPDDIDATAHVTVKPQDGGFRIIKSHIVCEATVRGVDPAAFKHTPRQPKRIAPYLKLSRGRTSRSRPRSLDDDGTVDTDQWMEPWNHGSTARRRSLTAGR
jgi:lipoyl-dependent peroxiredoxin